MFSLVLLILADKADGSRAARLAAYLAARHGAGFTALHVSGPVGQEGGCVLQLPDEAAQAAKLAEAEALLRAAMPPGLTADVSHAAGFLHVEALKTARILGPDLLVLGGLDAAERCRRELSDEGSSAALLLAAAAPCPVLVAPDAGSSPTGPFEHVLVSVDLAEGEERLLAQLGFAARLAAREGAAVTVLGGLPLEPGAPLPDQAEMTRRVAAARDRLAYLCRGLPGAGRFTLAAREGDPGQEILKQARECGADLLVLAPLENTTNAQAGRVLEGARCPALLLGPVVLAAQAASGR